MRLDVDPNLEIDDETARALRNNRLPGQPRGRARGPVGPPPFNPPRRSAPASGPRWWRSRRPRRTGVPRYLRGIERLVRRYPRVLLAVAGVVVLGSWLQKCAGG